MTFAESESDLKHSWNVGERERSSWMCDFLWCSEKKGQANKLKLANTGRSRSRLTIASRYKFVADRSCSVVANTVFTRTSRKSTSCYEVLKSHISFASDMPLKICVHPLKFVLLPVWHFCLF